MRRKSVSQSVSKCSRTAAGDGVKCTTCLACTLSSCFNLSRTCNSLDGLTETAKDSIQSVALVHLEKKTCFFFFCRKLEHMLGTCSFRFVNRRVYKAVLAGASCPASLIKNAAMLSLVCASGCES